MKTLTEKAIEAVMAGRIDEEDFDLIADIDLRVQRQITCPVSGKVLDSRTAVLVEAGSQKVAIHADAADEAVRLLHEAGIEEVALGFIPSDTLEVLR